MARSKTIHYKKVSKEGFVLPTRVEFESDGMVATYQNTIPVSTHRKEEVFVYLYTHCKHPHPVVGSSKLNTEVHWRRKEIDAMSKGFYIQFFYD